MQPAIVLASTSRFRREIVERLGLNLICAAPVCDETPLANEHAADTARRLARTKAESLGASHPHALIIGGDQVALLDNRQLGKPRDFDDAVAMLQSTAGRTLEFHTAIALYNPQSGRVQEYTDLTRVTMRKLGEAAIRNYLGREPDALYCAGAAMSEGLGGALIARIESTDPNALIGVPLFALTDMLMNEGVEIL